MHLNDTVIMKNTFSPILHCLLVIGVVCTTVSCKKDKLTDDLAVFKGRYSWSYTVFKEDWWSANTTTRPASNSTYTAEVEFTSKGKIIFFIDGVPIHKTGYSIESTEVSEDGETTWLTVRPFVEKSKDLDLNDNVSFGVRNDTLSINDFPGESYDATIAGTDYFIRN